MRWFRQTVLSLLVCLLLLAAVAWSAGASAETLTDGLWHTDGDHPTNWLDAGLHPDAR
jgi:hypothetical protein